MLTPHEAQLYLAEKLPERNTCGVYCFIHIASGRCYVGSSKDISYRAGVHIRNAEKGGKGCFYKALAEYGLAAFKFKVLKVCEPAMKESNIKIV